MVQLTECKTHGLTEHKEYQSQGKRLRCLQCQVVAVTKRRAKVKQLAVQYKGGKCEQCGYDSCIAALEFHHLDPNEKDFSISGKGITRSFEKIKEELEKCVLLCANCHREAHYMADC